MDQFKKKKFLTLPEHQEVQSSALKVIVKKSAKFISLFFLFTGCAPNFESREGEYVFNNPYYYGIIDQDVLKNHQNYKWI